MNSDYILIIISVLAIVTSIYSLMNLLIIKRKLSFLISSESPTCLEGKILLALKQVDEALSTSDILKKRVRELQYKAQLSITKKVLKRYNPFSDTGSNQSFSLCLLDSNLSGVIISSLYSRGQTNIYAKEIFEGESKNVLSEEEKEVLEKAIL